jgi:hypothetical protein
MPFTSFPSFSPSLLNPKGSHGSASGNANGNTAEASLLSPSNLKTSFNFNLFSTQTYQPVLIVPPPALAENEKKQSPTSLSGALLGLGAVSVVSAAVGAVVASNLKSGGDTKQGQKGNGRRVGVKVTGGVYGTLAAEVMGTAMHPPDESEEGNDGTV